MCGKTPDAMTKMVPLVLFGSSEVKWIVAESVRSEVGKYCMWIKPVAPGRMIWSYAPSVNFVPVWDSVGLEICNVSLPVFRKLMVADNGLPTRTPPIAAVAVYWSCGTIPAPESVIVGVETPFDAVKLNDPL